MKIQRRTVLKVGLGGAVVLALGGIGLSLRSTVMREPREELRVLDAKQFSILAAIADRIAPRNRPFPSAFDVYVPEKVDALLHAMHPADAAEVQQALNLMENAAAGLLLEGRTSTFTASDEDAQDEILNSWKTSNMQAKRMAFKALNALCSSAYYSSPEVYEAVGYPGPPDFRGTGG